MIKILMVLQDFIPDAGAGEVLRELSPWAYVIVILVLGIATVFYRLYTSQVTKSEELEKEFRNFISDSLSRQIEVSKDVIELVESSNTEVSTAMNKFESTDVQLITLLSEVKVQLASIESSLTQVTR